MSFERIGAGTAKDAERLTDERIRALENGEVIRAGDPAIFLGAVHVDNITVIKNIMNTAITGVQVEEPWTIEGYVSSHGIVYRVEAAATIGSEEQNN